MWHRAAESWCTSDEYQNYVVWHKYHTHQGLQHHDGLTRSSDGLLRLMKRVENRKIVDETIVGNLLVKEKKGIEDVMEQAAEKEGDNNGSPGSQGYFANSRIPSEYSGTLVISKTPKPVTRKLDLDSELLSSQIVMNLSSNHAANFQHAGLGQSVDLPIDMATAAATASQAWNEAIASTARAKAPRASDGDGEGGARDSSSNQELLLSLEVEKHRTGMFQQELQEIKKKLEASLQREAELQEKVKRMLNDQSERKCSLLQEQSKESCTLASCLQEQARANEFEKELKLEQIKRKTEQAKANAFEKELKMKASLISHTNYESSNSCLMLTQNQTTGRGHE